MTCLYHLILPCGKSRQAIKLFDRLGIPCHYTFPAHGTMKSPILDLLGLNDIRRDLIFFPVEEEKLKETEEEIESDLHLRERGGGIGFSLPITKITEKNPGKEGLHPMKHYAIYCIVDRGRSEDVLNAAKKAGSTGATVLHGRGSGIKDASTIFGFVIEPEKDLVFIIANEEQTPKISESIRQELKLDEANTGVLFTVELSSTVGLYKGN